MKPEEINKAIAEKCGWYVANECICNILRARDGSPELEPVAPLPDYYHSLDACAEFERTLGDSDSRPALDYWIAVGRVVSKPTKEPGKTYRTISEVDKMRATAPQRCEAFLRTHNLWKE